MRTSFGRLLVVLVVLALPCAVPQAARADEAPQDESAASKAFRDAWWAETGGGNLTQALDLYAKSADAEGPAAVRARALYRRAVVLQRIGKTEDAIRALERLAKDFAGEADLQTQARARLTEWTAVDLRSSFGDWFKRYQYSPEFQAKIVDLVLKLGSLGDAGNAAARELLSIGEASVPALREGLKNHALSERSLSILLALGRRARRGHGGRSGTGPWTRIPGRRSWPCPRNGAHSCCPGEERNVPQQRPEGRPRGAGCRARVVVFALPALRRRPPPRRAVGVHAFACGTCVQGAPGCARDGTGSQRRVPGSGGIDACLAGVGDAGPPPEVGGQPGPTGAHARLGRHQ